MRRILVVDDEPAITDAVENAFRLEEDYEVISSNDGQEGLDLFREKHPDLLILDWRLKGKIQGKDILIYAKKEFPQILVYVVTASVNFLKEIESLGADGYFLKPCDDLRERIKEILPPR